MSVISAAFTPMNATEYSNVRSAASSRVPKGFYDRQIAAFANTAECNFAKFTLSGSLAGVKINAAVQSFRNKIKSAKLEIEVTPHTKDESGEDLEHPYITLAKRDALDALEAMVAAEEAAATKEAAKAK
jgi:hypothetical protein